MKSLNFDLDFKLNQTQKQKIAQLDQEQKRHVESVLKRHIQACERLNVPPAYEVTINEAIDDSIVQCLGKDETREYVEPFMRYEQYVSPKIL